MSLLLMLFCAGCVSGDAFAKATGQGLFTYYADRVKSAPLRTPFFEQTLDEPSLTDYRLERNRKDEYVARRSVPGWDWKLHLPTESGSPWMLRWQPDEENPKVGLLIYYAGTVDGMDRVAVYRAVVVNMRSGKALSPALPLRTEDRWGRADGDQPVWSRSKTKLVVRHQSETIEIKLP